MLVAKYTAEKVLKDSDGNGCGVVHWAAYKGDLVSLKLLDYFNIDLNQTDSTQMTPLHRAVQASQTHVIEFLLEKGVDPSQADSQGRTCMDVAVSQGLDGPRRMLCKLLEIEGSKQALDGERDLESLKGATLRRKEKIKDAAKEFKEMAVHNLAATFWLVCVSLATFQYLTDMRTPCWEIAPRVALCFELGVPASLCLFFFVMYSDPGKVPVRLKGQSGVEDVMAAFQRGEDPDFSRLCTTTLVIKGLRTKYCSRTEACVEEFDHFCGWLNVAIGRGNHRPFIFLACTETFTQFCHLYLLWISAGQLVKADGFGEWAFAVVMEYPVLALMMFVHTFTAPGVMMLSVQQCRMIGMSLTTNEMINMGRYEHFWEEGEAGVGIQKRRTFRNPFSKGGWLPNCIDFWWARRRGDRGPVHTSGTKGSEPPLGVNARHVGLA